MVIGNLDPLTPTLSRGRGGFYDTLRGGEGVNGTAVTSLLFVLVIINQSLAARLPHDALCHLSGLDLQMYSFLLLKVTDYGKEVARLGVPFWPEHSHETLTRFIEDLG